MLRRSFIKSLLAAALSVPVLASEMGLWGTHALNPLAPDADPKTQPISRGFANAFLLAGQYQRGGAPMWEGGEWKDYMAYLDAGQSMKANGVM